MLTLILLPLTTILIFALHTRFLLPESIYSNNPLVMRGIVLTDRLTNSINGTLRLPRSLLYILSITLILWVRAALLYRLGVPQGASIYLSPWLTYSFAPGTNLLAWFIIADMQIVVFWIHILTLYLILCVWSKNRITGMTGNLIAVIGRPFSNLPTPLLFVFIALVHIAIVITCGAFSVKSPNLSLMQQITLFESTGLKIPLDLENLAPLTEIFLNVMISISSVISSMLKLLITMIFINLFALIVNKPFLSAVANDGISLILGPIPPFRIGSVDLRVIFGYFLFSFLSSTLFLAILYLAYFVNYVVSIL